MKKKDLIIETTEKIHLPQKDVSIIVDTVLNTITNALKENNKVEIRDFGVFKVKNRHSKIVRNPKTGKKFTVAATKVPYFKVSKILLKQIRNN